MTEIETSGVSFISRRLSDRSSFVLLEAAVDARGEVSRSVLLADREIARGPWLEFPQLCEYGLRHPPKGGLASPVRADQIETAIAFLRRFKPTKRGTDNSYFLKHEAERWGRRNGMSAYVSNGALIAAALSLGLAVDEYLNCWPTSPNARIGISKRDFNKFMREERKRHVG